MTSRAFLGMSHSPLMGLNDIPDNVERDLQAAISAARQQVLQFAPELIVLVAPDHYNGFFNELMPPFCIGTAAHAVGDYLSPKGDLNVAADEAVSLATRLMDNDFDCAISRRMLVDHGFSQTLQLMWGGLDTPPVIPVFVNAVAQPGIPRMRRCAQLGRAIGSFLDSVPKRVLLIGSGGLSHEPPVPTLSHPDPAVRERITVRATPSEADKAAKTQRVMAAGRALADGTGTIKALNSEWDKRWMDGISGTTQDVDALCTLNEDSIEREAGLSAHESKSWLVARSALSGDAKPVSTLSYYRSIPEYIAGFGILVLNQPH